MLLACSLLLQISVLQLFLRKLDLSGVTLVAHDWGAMWALWGMPDIDHRRISRLVLTNSALPPHPWPREFPMSSILTVFIWLCWTILVGRHIPVTPVVLLIGEHVALADALGYGAPFPVAQLKAAVVRAPRLVGPLPFVDAPTMRCIRSWLPVRAMEALWPPLTDILDANERTALKGAKARAFFRSAETWPTPTLVIFGEEDPLFAGLQHVLTREVFNAKALSYCPEAKVIKQASHFFPEERPELLAAEMLKFMAATAKEASGAWPA